MNRLVQWFVDNPIAANLLMAIIIVGGITNLINLNKEVFPGARIGTISVTVAYPGANPAEVEEQIVKRVEETIADLEGIDKISTTSSLGSGRVVATAINGYDVQRLLNNIKSRVDSINTFPSDTERPLIREQLWQSEILSLAIYGHADEARLKKAARRVRDDVSLLPGISTVTIEGVRTEEMAIEISEQSLRQYQLSFDQVVEAIRRSSLNLPAGVIRSQNGDIQLQSRGQAYNAKDFGKIVVNASEDGSKLYLRDVATITDGFAEQNFRARLNGSPAVFLKVRSSETPDVLESTATIKNYLQTVKLPQGMEITIWEDWSELFKGRMNLLLKNAVSGLVLVFIVLMLFLRPALAAWVSVGIFTAFMGALWLLPYLDVSLNMISMFSFLLVLGIIVDDAIIVGESIYSRQQDQFKGSAAAASGARMVSKPVFFAVVSTMIFFVPLLGIEGTLGDICRPIPVVVMLALLFSLIESLLILPSHLSHLKEEVTPKNPALKKLQQTRFFFAGQLNRISETYYQPLLDKALKNPTITLASFTLAFAMSLALFNGGWLTRSFMPVVVSDFIRLNVVMPEGTSQQRMHELTTRLEKTVDTLRKDKSLLDSPDMISNQQTWSWDNNVFLSVSLAHEGTANVSPTAISARWRELIGDIPSAESVQVDSTINQMSEDIRLRFSINSSDRAEMLRATSALKAVLNSYRGVYDVKNTLTDSRTDIEINLKSHAETLQLGMQEIARQVRQGFYGQEVQRIPRGHEDVRVMVRYPKEERQQVQQLTDMRIRTNDGGVIPLESVADIRFVPGHTKIERIDRKRVIVVTAQVEDGVNNPSEIVADIFTAKMPALHQQFPSMQLLIDGDMEEESDFMKNAAVNFILAVLVIYCLMAVAFSSYWQPLLILTAVPFGFMGAIIGHLLMGREISIMSMLGFFACAGVVVNDNLVLLDRINQLRKQGVGLLDSVSRAGHDRFRAIILTSLTTFIGLTPILAETSTQAQFLIPMVISLSFGVLFATPITLILVPTLYLLGERASSRSKNHGQDTEVEEIAAPGSN